MDKYWFVPSSEKAQFHFFLLYKKSGKTPPPIQSHGNLLKHE